MQRPLTYVEICAGAVGQALGLALAGFEHVAFVEYESEYCETLKKNRPDWNVICADVHDFNGLPYQDVDLLAGGVPVRLFSVAGKQLGKDDDGLQPTTILAASLSRWGHRAGRLHRIDFKVALRCCATFHLEKGKAARLPLHRVCLSLCSRDSSRVPLR